MDYLYRLDTMTTEQRSRVGGSAASLANIKRLGYATLPCLILSHQAWQDVVTTLPLRNPLLQGLGQTSLHLDLNNAYQLQQLSQEIHDCLMAAPLPTTVEAALTTTCDALPGSVLYVTLSLGLLGGKPGSQASAIAHLSDIIVPRCCPRNLSALSKTVCSLWAEVFSASNLLYWQAAQISLKSLRAAVVFQPLLPSAVSGTLTVSPSQALIESSWGLSLAFPGGDIVPDRYHISPNQVPTTSQTTIGCKQLAYWHELLAPPPWLHEENVPASSIGLRPVTNGCSLLSVGPDYQQRPSLSHPQLEALLQLQQQLQQNWAPDFTLHWIYGSPGNNQPEQFYITSASPQTLATLAAAWLGEETLPDLPQPSTTLPPAPSAQTFKGRSTFLGKVRALAYVVTDLSTTCPIVPADHILVVPLVVPQWLRSLEQVMGIITEQGGLTSHAALLAREFDIPTIVGVSNATQQLKTGDWIELEGDRGLVSLIDPPHQRRAKRDGEQPSQSVFLRHQHQRTPLRTQLYVTLSQPKSVAQAVKLPVSGLGLLRADGFLPTVLSDHALFHLDDRNHRSWIAQMSAAMASILKAFAPGPVFYRTLDWPLLDSNTATPMHLNIAGLNPLLGAHGAFSYQTDNRLFQLELTALEGAVAQAQGQNLRLLLPFVRSVAEFRACQKQIRQAGLMAQPGFELWMMAEVPSILFRLPAYAEAGLQGIAIGLNDLTQLVLAADRNLASMADIVESEWDAVQQAIARLVQQAKRLGLGCHLCGYVPELPMGFLEFLVEIGLPALSVDLSNVESTYARLEEIERAQRRHKAPPQAEL